MSGKLFDQYGAICAEDVGVLEFALANLTNPPFYQTATPTIRVLEIGMHDGGTAAGMERFVNARGSDLQYWGIDPDDGTTRARHVPVGGCVIIGDSAEVFAEVPAQLDLVIVDGCHCMNHVILDTVHYAPKVRIGGFLLFHDVNPRGQGKGHQYHGPDRPEFGLAIDMAHAAIRFPWPEWKMVDESWPDDRNDCGMRAYRRTA